ncbi:hypothetical protein [Roseovarius atlanticus]|uniref:hypothetical protein n=1 Tax=Roseovarius atlanticus TaxID=1641875 RepID=UPI001C967AA2|nr:hypothetical protein [Roseovarius atlanticus]MBY5990411.1 hypothetical protein [Roseovarius atlanticus]MBY6126957.1 hypothetical protein [Roseovarius atlanticus]MBY6151450.1 hypothetical protein [Roseovarius atlanticus]
MTLPHRFHIAALTVLILGSLVAGRAQAQDAPCSHAACRAAQAVAPACRIYMEASTGRATFSHRALQGRVSFASRDQPDGCLRRGQAYALQGWRFNNRGGHKVQRLRLLQRAELFDIAFEDGDGGDYIDGFAWLVPLPEGVPIRTVQARECRGQCRLTLPGVRATDTVVLTGFEVARVGGDGHVRELAIGPADFSGGQGMMPVTFRDDDFAFRATVQYAVLPRGMVSGDQRARSDYARQGLPNLLSARYIHPDLQRPSGAGARMLRGFRMAFGNGGHFLEDVGIEPLPMAYMAWFQDNQPAAERRVPDDPLAWSVDWVSAR